MRATHSCHCGGGHIRRPTRRRVAAQLDAQRRETRPQHRRRGPENPDPVRGVGHIHLRRDRSHPAPPTGRHDLHHPPDRRHHIESTDQQKRRDQSMRHAARRAPRPGHPQPKTGTPNPNRTLIPRPKAHRHPTRRTHQTRRYHATPRSDIHLDRNRTRPYDGHGWIRHPSGPLPAERQLERTGKGPSRTRTPIPTPTPNPPQTPRPKPPHPPPNSQAANTSRPPSLCRIGGRKRIGRLGPTACISGQRGG